ncbi:hypothetical protein HU200_056974 [Digitaria exilis]|uniref:HTH La-type RNA-binding domain-containing protein n=1 Tax=Digitaria exilis TaxID=1010633 RepID=A0A835ALK5_9POAL|nr:hypothetical protein HU200_056974 [Digitaria exilis]
MEEPNVAGAAVAADPAASVSGGAGVGATASPWRKTTPPPSAPEAAVMGAESWPALEEARQKVTPECPAKAGAGNAGRGAKEPQGSPPPPPSSQVQPDTGSDMVMCMVLFLWITNLLRQLWVTGQCLLIREEILMVGDLLLVLMAPGPILVHSIIHLNSGPMHPMYYYMPAVPMEPMRGPPRYIQNQPVPSTVLSPEDAELRSKVLTQVEYYFSDTNLERDDFLKSLMDENGWVPVSKVADFNRLKKMTTDIHLIVDALANSSVLEAQDDKIRRRSDWSKWVSFSGTSSIASPSSASMDSSMGERNTSGFSNKDGDSEDQKKHCQSQDIGCHTDYTSTKAKVADEQVQDARISLLNRDLSAISIDEKPKSLGAQPLKSSKHGSSFRSGDFKVQKVKAKINTPDSQSDFSNFGGDQSTFMLDEELELEHADHSRDDRYSHKRGDDEDDDFFVDDQDVNRLIIVTQDTRLAKDDKSRPSIPQAFSTEEASRISDALYHYETLHGRRTNNQRGTQADTADVNSKPTDGSKGNHISSGSNGSEETGQPIPRKRQSRGSRKANSSRKQRFFAGNFMSNPDQYSGVSESPPGNSVGYFYGSTPENHSYKSSKLSSSPHGIPTGSSPVGSMPKSSPQSQHLNYHLLEKNKLQQQRAASFTTYSFLCSYGLEKNFQPNVYEDFEKLTLEFYHNGDLYGLEKYWAFHHYRNPDSGPIDKLPELERLLREEFRTLDDFKAKGKAHDSSEKETGGSNSTKAVAASHSAAETK